MGQNSKISWTTYTWNPWQGCKKISPGCDFCYMYRDKIRYGNDPSVIVQSTKATFNKPLTWHKNLSPDAPLHERLVFSSSWTDFFISQADEWRDEAWAIIRNTPNLIYQILTKRPHRIAKCLPANWGEGYPNVWLGTTVENQAMAEQRIPILSAIPARLRFLSVEPLLERVDLFHLLGENQFLARRPDEVRDPSPIGWIIVGGESGNDKGDYTYRPCEPKWLEEVIEDADHFQIPVWMKQTGTALSKRWSLDDRHGAVANEWPDYLQVQELPKFPISYEKA